MKLIKTALNRLASSNACVPVLAIRSFAASMMALLLVTLPANAQDTPADVLADPALDLKSPPARALFGKGNPFTMEELPPVTLKSKMEGQDPGSSGKAMNGIINQRQQF